MVVIICLDQRGRWYLSSTVLVWVWVVYPFLCHFCGQVSPLQLLCPIPSQCIIATLCMR